MASHGRPAERGYHQDYIARIRYENNLPPPPGAPKLLNIPIEGLNYYTSAAFASRMARQQPLNIEADAELGMPIDLVGMPGIFDGDESSIQAPLATPPVHPKDKNLLRPVSELGKPKFTAGVHSFLRRTEYISSDAKARADANMSATKGPSKSPVAKFQRRQTDQNKDDPVNLARHVIKSFDIAHPEDVYAGPEDTRHLHGAKSTPAEIEAWRQPRHPTNPDLKLLDSYPIKPDLAALPDQGAYMRIKFAVNPAGPSKQHDKRLDVGLLNPVEAGQDYEYPFYLPPDQSTAKSLKRNFESLEEDEDEREAQYSHGVKDGHAFYKYYYQRTFDMERQLTTTDHPYQEIGLALHDPDIDKETGAPKAGARLDKGAYYYPIGVKMNLKPKRNKNLANLGLQKQAPENEGDRPDEINLIIRHADAEEAQKRNGHRDELLPEENVTNGAIKA